MISHPQVRQSTNSSIHRSSKSACPCPESVCVTHHSAPVSRCGDRDGGSASTAAYSLRQTHLRASKRVKAEKRRVLCRPNPNSFSRMRRCALQITLRLSGPLICCSGHMPVVKPSRHLQPKASGVKDLKTCIYWTLTFSLLPIGPFHPSRSRQPNPK